ncbi:hypothetical protein CA596_29740 [Paenibacillus odorifer]|nr:hypothetical protein CA596_29740 [Paenibacillus odorifer]
MEHISNENNYEKNEKLQMAIVVFCMVDLLKMSLVLPLLYMGEWGIGRDKRNFTYIDLRCIVVLGIKG